LGSRSADRKKNRKAKRSKIGRKIALFLVLVTGAQVYAFHHYNSILTGSIHVKTNVEQPVKPPSIDTQKEIASLTKQYPVSAASEDNTSFAYVDNQNVLYIKDLVHNTILATVNNTYPVQYLEWIGNESVFVGEQESPGVLELKTVDANSGTERVIHTFSGLSAADSFKKIAYTVLTNDVYILIGSDTSSVVYHYDTNSNLNVIYLGGRYIKNIEVSQTGNQLYFEDYVSGSFNVLVRSQGSVHLISRNSALISVADNTLYYGSVDQNGLVTAVYKYDDSTGTGVLVSNMQQPTLASEIEITSDGQVHVQQTTA
jgi:hypothetical protein